MNGPKEFQEALDKVPAINNHTCKSCQNKRCNSNEKSCWKCGEPIKS